MPVKAGLALLKAEKRLRWMEDRQVTALKANECTKF
jgi:hypothetical protein